MSVTEAKSLQCRNMTTSKTLSQLVIILYLWRATHCLLYPANSVFQLVGGVSVPVTELPKSYRVNIDWGLQVVYDFPFELSNFYNVPIFPNLFGNSMSKRSYAPAMHEQSIRNYSVESIQWDLSTAAFYRSLEQLLIRYDIDPSCLLLAICELALHPFEQQQCLLTELLTVIFTPSRHDDLHSADGAAYKAAEKRGANGQNCEEIYAECRFNLFASITQTYF